MEQRTILKYGIPLGILAILGGLYFAMHPLSQGLLTPPPGGFVQVGMVIGIGLAFVAAYMLAKDISSRLARRLTVIFVMALTLYTGGESARGLYAMSAFSTPGELEEQQWTALNVGDDTILLHGAGYPRALFLPATAEAVAAAQLGYCVTISVERSAEGDERIAPAQLPLQATQVSSC